MLPPLLGKTFFEKKKLVRPRGMAEHGLCSPLLFRSAALFSCAALRSDSLPPTHAYACWQPTAVNFKAKDLKAEFQRAACGTMYRHATGTSTSLQVGTTEQPAEHLVENVVTAVELAVTHQIAGKWNNVQSLQLRSTNTIALPFYNAMPHA